MFVRESVCGDVRVCVEAEEWLCVYQSVSSCAT